jgi:hypothetical protein
MKTNNNNLKSILKRAKLLMEYDLNKTHDENLALINEQLDGSSEDPSYDVSICNEIKEGSQGSFARYKGTSVNPKLGLANLPKGWKAVDIPTLNKDVSGDNGLVDSLDLGITETIEDDIALGIINKHKQSAVINTRDNKYYPAIEYMRARYEKDEGGDSIMVDLDDPPGVDTMEKMDACENIQAAIESAYSLWLTALRTANNCDGSQKAKDNRNQDGNQGGNQGGITPPIEGQSNCVEKLSIEDSGTMNISGAVVKYYDVPFDRGAGYNRIFCRKDTCITGSFIAYNSGDQEIGRGSWACRSNSFKITEYKKKV